MIPTWCILSTPAGRERCLVERLRQHLARGTWWWVTPGLFLLVETLEIPGKWWSDVEWKNGWTKKLEKGKKIELIVGHSHVMSFVCKVMLMMLDVRYTTYQCSHENLVSISNSHSTSKTSFNRSILEGSKGFPIPAMDSFWYDGCFFYRKVTSKWVPPPEKITGPFQLPSLKLIAKAPENRPNPKRKGLSPNHHFSGANC